MRPNPMLSVEHMIRDISTIHSLPMFYTQLSEVISHPRSSIGDIAKHTLDWWNAQPEERRAKPRAGLPAEREVEVLAAWHGRESGTKPS